MEKTQRNKKTFEQRQMFGVTPSNGDATIQSKPTNFPRCLSLFC